MSIIRYGTPEFRLSSLRDLFESAFDLSNVRTVPFGNWSPALDVHQDDNQVTVRLELPGFRKEDFDVQLNDKVLTISGERKTSEEHRFRSERFSGAFSRSIELPSAVKADEVRASYVDGVLTVTLPKAEEAKPKKIEVTLS